MIAAAHISGLRSAASAAVDHTDHAAHADRADRADRLERLDCLDCRTGPKFVAGGFDQALRASLQTVQGSAATTPRSADRVALPGKDPAPEVDTKGGLGKSDKGENGVVPEAGATKNASTKAGVLKSSTQSATSTRGTTDAGENASEASGTVAVSDAVQVTAYVGAQIANANVEGDADGDDQQGVRVASGSEALTPKNVATAKDSAGRVSVPAAQVRDEVQVAAAVAPVGSTAKESLPVEAQNPSVGTLSVVQSAVLHGPMEAAPAMRHAPKVEAQSPALMANDAHVRTDEARVYEASTGALEVGVASATHGWLRVRAEMGDAGLVTAQVVAASAGAVASLHKELPAISAYLAHEQVGVNSLVVNAMSAGAGAGDQALESGVGGWVGSGSGRSGAGEDGSRAWRTGVDAELRGDDELGYLAPAAGFGSLGVPAALYGAGANGGWLSVRV